MLAQPIIAMHLAHNAEQSLDGLPLHRVVSPSESCISPVAVGNAPGLERYSLLFKLLDTCVSTARFSRAERVSYASDLRASCWACTLLTVKIVTLVLLRRIVSCPGHAR